MPLPKIIAIVGPTASGKTAAGIAVARAVDGEVICADSRTIFRGLDIGTAKPVGERDFTQGKLGEERPLLVDGVPHWGIDICEPDEVFTAAEFQVYADKKIADILERGKVPVLVGGTGLYVSAVIDRLTFADAEPDTDLRVELATLSHEELLEEIGDRDPETAETIDPGNRRRLERAVEILRKTGKTLAEARVHGEKLYDALQIGMSVDRELLYQRIDDRVSEMIARGLVDEVRNLKEKYGTEANAMTGIGYRQILAFLLQKTSLKDAIARIKYDSHHYAKRQETWFKRDQRIVWVGDVKDVVQRVVDFLK